MATSTTNLGLTKPAGTDKIRIAQINGNMDILDDKIGAVGNTSLQAQITSQNEAISNLNIINLSTSTSIASLCSSCPSGEHRYYGATVSTTFSDFPSEYGTLYHPIVHIIKRVNGYEIIINAVNGSNVPTQINGWFENNAFKWEKLALNSKIEPLAPDNSKTQINFNAQQAHTVDLGITPSSEKYASVLLIVANQGILSEISCTGSGAVKTDFGTALSSVSLSGSTLTVNFASRPWGLCVALIHHN